MSIPMDPPYCLVYPMGYVRDLELDNLDTNNNPAGIHLLCCICCATLQYMNDDPNQHREYSGSHLILPHRAQYKEQLFPKILKPQNHWEPLGATDRFHHQGAFSHGSSGRLQVNRPNLQRVLQQLIPPREPMWTWADSGGMGYIFLHTRVKSQHHQLLPICKPGSPRQQSSPHQGPLL